MTQVVATGSACPFPLQTAAGVSAKDSPQPASSRGFLRFTLKTQQGCEFRGTCRKQPLIFCEPVLPGSNLRVVPGVQAEVSALQDLQESGGHRV